MRAPCADARALEMAVGLDLGAVLDGDARAEEDVGLDDDVAADLGVERQPDGLRRDQRHALLHDARARARFCQMRLGGGELIARVDAEHLVLRAVDDGGARPAARAQISTASVR